MLMKDALCGSGSTCPSMHECALTALPVPRNETLDKMNRKAQFQLNATEQPVAHGVFRSYVQGGSLCYFECAYLNNRRCWFHTVE